MARLKIFTALNHLSNEYEVLKLAKKYPVKFYYLENNVRRWSKYAARPEPTTWLSKEEFEWVQYYEPGKYDLAILRVDQQHVNPDIGKGWLYRDLNEVIKDIPKLVVNHGTPMYDEVYDEDTVINGGIAHTKNGPKKIIGMKEKIGDNFMVVNSYESVNRWGWGYPIIHGMDADEWYDLPKEPRVILSVSPGGLDKYYNRQLISAIKSEVKMRSGIDVIHYNVNIEFEKDNWAQYREFTARSLISINPFLDSPMPRSRTEQMLSGCCVLSSKHHNADEFIEHGVNGFIVPDNPLSYAEAIHYLINECYKDAVQIGQAGKESAKKLFNWERFADDFYHVMYEVANGRRPVWDGTKVWDKPEHKANKSPLPYREKLEKKAINR